VIGYLAVNRMPRLYERIDECDFMRGATSERWIVAIRSDVQKKIASAHMVLDRLHPAAIEEVPAPRNGWWFAIIAHKQIIDAAIPAWKPWMSAILDVRCRGKYRRRRSGQLNAAQNI
jgi:hypothetical protein